MSERRKNQGPRRQSTILHSSLTIHHRLAYTATDISPPNWRYVLTGAHANPL